jgi:hypothetical protein
MADGISAAAAASAGLGGATIVLTGSFLGVQYDVLTLALFGGLAALLHLPPLPGIFHKFGSVWTAAFLGGSMAPVATAGALHYAPMLGTDPGPVAVRLACAFAIGLLAQPAIPLAFSLLKRKSEAL